MFVFLFVLPFIWNKSENGFTWLRAYELSFCAMLRWMFFVETDTDRELESKLNL